MEPKLFINGSWRDAQRGGKLDVIDPATERVFQQCAAGGAEDIDAAVAAAKAAMQGPWRRTSGKDRAKFLRAIAAAIEERKHALAEIEVKDNGKPLPEALWDIGDAAYCFNLYAGYAEDLDARQGEVVAVPDARFQSRVKYMPAGVAGLIVPWNYP
ncbi:MAG TPA: aldehyde dehydrogenase family protein, partial [Hyphomicrobium sp.]